MNKVIITGTGGFIGHHLTLKLLHSNFEVIGIDNLNSYYDINLKIERLKIQGIKYDFIESEYKDEEILSSKYNNYKFYFNTINNFEFLDKIVKLFKPIAIINLAAQAGVRYSITNPKAYFESNVDGFLNILESAKNNKIEHVYYASSSSVYGTNEKTPFAETDNVDSPASIYATTKKCNELMAHTYSHLFKIRTTGLRFFTVYGPYGRPDMAIFLFTEAILKNKPINVFNNGNLIRDFTYIDDIIESIFRLLNKDLSTINNKLYNIYNIGNNKPVLLLDFINSIERHTKKRAIINNQDMQQGDVKITHADINKLISATDYVPKININDGVSKFVEWYINFYNISNI